MRYRSRASFASGVVITTIALLVIGPGRHASAQQAPPASRPDLEGIWNYSSLTPLERPAELTGKEYLTPQEAAAFTRQVLERNNMDRRDGSADADVARAYNDAWYDRGTKVATVHGRTQTSLVIDPPDGRLPALTAEAQRRAADRAQARRDHPADGPEDRSLAERCLSFNAGPPMLPGPYNNFVQILQFRDRLVIANEMIHDARIVPLDGRPHRAASIRSWQGDSVGRWQGETLVVDTVNFTDKTAFRGSSDRLHLVERFTRADASTLLYEFTVDDPSSFTKPWTVSLPMTKSSDHIYEYACHEGNYALPDILRGARAQEKSDRR